MSSYHIQTKRFRCSTLTLTLGIGIAFSSLGGNCVSCFSQTDSSKADSADVAKVDQNYATALPQVVMDRLKQHAVEQTDAWQKMYLSAPAEHRRAIAFQLQHMPPADLKALQPEFIAQNTQLAYAALEAAAWKDQISEQLFFNDILPYANIDETREDWRSDFHKQFASVVADCKTPGEAAQKLNREVFNKVNVHYSTKRRKANQSPSESIEQSMASCTGLSILLVDACRSVGVPARLAGIPSWVDKRGNHTWVEVWDNGKWHFTGADEPSDQGLNHAWFEADAKKALKDKRMNSIYAVSFQQTDTRFPMVWSRDGSKTVYAVNVTDRYTNSDADTTASHSVKLRVRVWLTKGGERIPAKVSLKCLQCIDEPPVIGTSKAGRADMNDLLEFEVVRGRTYQLKAAYEGKESTAEVKIDQNDSQLQEIYLSAEE